MKREIKAYIEAELRDYHQTKKDLEELKEDIRLESPVFENTGGSRGIEVSRPVENKVTRLMTNKRIKRMEQVITAIENILGELDEPKTKLIELKYWQRPRQLTDAGIGSQIGCDKTTVWRWASGILLAIAIELGLENETCNKFAIHNK